MSTGIMKMIQCFYSTKTFFGLQLALPTCDHMSAGYIATYEMIYVILMNPMPHKSVVAYLKIKIVLLRLLYNSQHLCLIHVCGIKLSFKLCLFLK